MEVSGQVSMADAQRACAPLGKRLHGWRRYAGLIVLIPVVFAGLLAQTIFDFFVEGGFGIFAFLISLGVGFFLMLKVGYSMTQKSWSKRGVPLASTVTYRLLDDGILFEAPFAATHVKWLGVTEIAPGRDAWLFITQGAAHFLPRRLFQSKLDESAFLAACLNRMTPEAQGRSVEAAALIASLPSRA